MRLECVKNSYYMHYKFYKILPRSVNKKNRSVGNLFYNVQKYRDGFGITRAVLFYFHRIALVKEQFVILSKTGSLYRQPNLFRLFLSTSSVLEHELKTHISDVLKTVYLLLIQIGCFHIYKKFFQSCNKSHPAVQIWCGKRDTYFSLHSERGCDFETIRLPKDNTVSV